MRAARARALRGRTASNDPTQALERFASDGAEWAHIVDLDGARAREPRQHELIANLARGSALKLQVAGGFRTADQIAAMLDAGVARVVIGSLAVKEPEIVQGFLKTFGGDRITIALDVNIVDGGPMVATAGWTETSGRTLWNTAALYREARHLLVTDISRDGMLTGPNFDLLAEAVERLPHLSVQASGGIASLEDLKPLRTAGVIIGKALWEGRIALREAVALARA